MRELAGVAVEFRLEARVVGGRQQLALRLREQEHKLLFLATITVGSSSSSSTSASTSATTTTTTTSAMSATYSSSSSSVVLTEAPPTACASFAIAVFRLSRASAALFALLSASLRP
jgi:hypothetical protein